MAKVTRKKLGRGVELVVDQVFDPMVDMASEIGNIEADQMQARYATFRMNFNIPWLGSKYFYDNRTIGTTATTHRTAPATTYPSVPGWVYGVPVDGGSGEGLTVNILLTGTGTIDEWLIENPGTGYLDYDVVDIKRPDTGAVPATSQQLLLRIVDDEYDGPFYIPFCLPPLQENIVGEASVLPKDGTPSPILDEVSFSLDQSDEPAMILGQWYGRDKYQYEPSHRWMPNPYAGKKTYTRSDAYDFTLSIYEKEQFFFTGSVLEGDEFNVKSEAVSLRIPPTAFLARSTRFNPISVGDINRQFDPLKTYCLAIFAPKLHDVGTSREHCVANNVWVSLKFKMPLTSRDEASAVAETLVQNMPKNYGDSVAPSVSITSPAAETPVIADGTNAGVSTNLQLIDQQFSDKLRGGYNDFSQTYPTQNVVDDAAYEVLTVPIGAGFTHNRMSARDDYPLAPYVTGSTFGTTRMTTYTENPYIDRRIIPIDGEMTIHHVVVALNWSSDKIQRSNNPAGGGPFPYSGEAGKTTYRTATMPGTNPAPHTGTVKYSVGVGMLAGPRADDFEYQQIAYSEFTPGGASFTAPPNGLIDAIRLGLPACDEMTPAEWVLLSVPVRNQAALAYPAPVANGTGYWGFETTPAAWLKGQQGRPYFVGEGNSFTADRTPVGSAAGGAAVGTPLAGAEGCEQFLEVRLSVDPQDAVYTAVGAPVTALDWSDTYGEGDIFLGYGGCWVYIIGKKHLK